MRRDAPSVRAYQCYQGRFVEASVGVAWRAWIASKVAPSHRGGSTRSELGGGLDGVRCARGPHQESARVVAGHVKLEGEAGQAELATPGFAGQGARQKKSNSSRQKFSRSPEGNARLLCRSLE